MRVDPSFWSGRRVLVTGHTGFKGSWATLWLAAMGARVTGIALEPDTVPSLFELAGVGRNIISHLVDIQDLTALHDIVAAADPELVLHMAAQPLVRRSFAEPMLTFAVNVQGTAHLLEALRSARALRAVLVVTTDKVYENSEQGRPFVEDDALGGYDPYAASKAASELVTRSMARAFLEPSGVRVATARGGNVIGGGDFSADRLIPDIVRAVAARKPLILRYPDAIRPWQHVLDCLGGYFIYLQMLCATENLPRSLNIGPAGAGLTVGSIATAMLDALGAKESWQRDDGAHEHESTLLALDTTLARHSLGWSDCLPGDEALAATAHWYREWQTGADMRQVTLRQIDAYLNEPR